jgi:hypothetical protein
MMADLEWPDVRDIAKTERLFRMNGVEYRLGSVLRLPQAKQIEIPGAELNGLLGAIDMDQPLMKHQAVEDRRQTVDMVSVNVRHQDRAQIERVEAELLNPLDDAARRIDEDKILSRVEKKRRVIPLRDGERPARAQKSQLDHFDNPI